MRQLHSMKLIRYDTLPFSFFSLRSLVTLQAMLPKSVQGKGALGARCDYIGSSTNLVSLKTTLTTLDSNYSRDGVGRHYECPVVGVR
jgi:hypothetical protein